MTARTESRILAAISAACALPFAAVLLLPSRLHGVMDVDSYLVFHNTAEFFSIMVCLSVFGVGWYAYDQSKDRHALFLGTAFLATGLLDFMHTLSNAAMPAFITPNSTNKSTQFWIAARLVGSTALFASAFLLSGRGPRWMTKRILLAAALATCAAVFAGVTFFPAQLPVTFVPGAGLTPFKVGAEFLAIGLLAGGGAAYWVRMRRTGDDRLLLYLAAFVIGIFSEAVFASYRTGFDTFNVLGHLYKVAAFSLVYRAAFVASVARPYVQLTGANARLRTEIADRLRAEEAVRALNADLETRVAERTSGLEAANRALEENRASLRDASLRKDEFLGMLSHELRNPLAPIRNSVYVLERSAPGSEQASRARAIIRRQTEHLARLVDDLLDVTRIARGKIELLRARVDLRDVVLRTADDFRAVLEQRGLGFRTAVPGASVWCDADATRIAQVLGNLLHNAAKFTGAGGEVSLSLAATGSAAELAVRDTGVGLDPALLPHVFDPFVQGDRSLARVEGGLGLGLALVKGVAELHGGSVVVRSEGPGRGAEFVVRLPLAPAGAAAAESRIDPLDAKPADPDRIEEVVS